MAKQFWFEIETGSKAGTRILIRGGSLGSSPNAAVRLDDSSIAPFHCDIGVDGEGTFISEANQTTIMTVNGNRTRKRILAHGDVIIIGKHTLRVLDNLDAPYEPPPKTTLPPQPNEPKVATSVAQQKGSVVENINQIPELEERHFSYLVQFSKGIDELRKGMDNEYNAHISYIKFFPKIMHVLEKDECPLMIASINVESPDAKLLLTTLRLLVLSSSKDGAVVTSIRHENFQKTSRHFVDWKSIDAKDLDSQFLKNLGSFAGSFATLVGANLTLGLSLFWGNTDFRRNLYKWTDVHYLDGKVAKSCRLFMQNESKKYTVMQNQELNAHVVSFCAKYTTFLMRTQRDWDEYSINLTALIRAAAWERKTGKEIQSHESFLRIIENRKKVDMEKNLQQKVQIQYAPKPADVKRLPKERLLELQELLDMGAITKENYEQKKSEILREL